MTVKIREIKLKNNQLGIQLDIHNNGKRIQKMLDIRYAEFPRTAIEREDKKSKKEIIKKIVAKMELDAIYSDNMLTNDYNLNKDFFVFCEEFIERKAPHSEMRTYKSVVAKFRIFTKSSKLLCSEINEGMLQSFKDYLDSNLNGCSSFNYFKKLKRIIKEATIAKHFKSNPTENLTNKRKPSIQKQTLTNKEIQELVKTGCGNNQVRNAFLFSCLTGLRYCDIIRLKWDNVKNGILDIIQIKTSERLQMQLHTDAISILETQNKSSEYIFNLPSHTGCLKSIRKWVKDAEIDKHITWHCARHSFATALVVEDTNITTVSKLLGHKSLSETMTYVRVAELSKINAINNLPSIYKAI